MNNLNQIVTLLQIVLALLSSGNRSPQIDALANQAIVYATIAMRAPENSTASQILQINGIVDQNPLSISAPEAVNSNTGIGAPDISTISSPLDANQLFLKDILNGITITSQPYGDTDDDTVLFMITANDVLPGNGIAEGANTYFAHQSLDGNEHDINADITCNPAPDKSVSVSLNGIDTHSNIWLYKRNTDYSCVITGTDSAGNIASTTIQFSL